MSGKDNRNNSYEVHSKQRVTSANLSSTFKAKDNYLEMRQEETYEKIHHTQKERYMSLYRPFSSQSDHSLQTDEYRFLNDNTKGGIVNSTEQNKKKRDVRLLREKRRQGQLQLNRMKLDERQTARDYYAVLDLQALELEAALTIDDLILDEQAALEYSKHSNEGMLNEADTSEYEAEYLEFVKDEQQEIEYLLLSLDLSET